MNRPYSAYGAALILWLQVAGPGGLPKPSLLHLLGDERDAVRLSHVLSRYTIDGHIVRQRNGCWRLGPEPIDVSGPYGDTEPVAAPRPVVPPPPFSHRSIFDLARSL